jgi:hypothetical protein
MYDNRPITLLNTDYRVFARVIADRLRYVPSGFLHLGEQSVAAVGIKLDGAAV